MNTIPRFGTVTEDGLFMPFIKIPGFERRVRERERRDGKNEMSGGTASLSRHGFNETIVFEDCARTHVCFQARDYIYIYKTDKVAIDLALLPRNGRRTKQHGEEDYHPSKLIEY